MATKLKGWTARLSVKICCVILIPVMLFISLYGAYGLAKLDDISMELLFADLDKNDNFYKHYISDAYYHVYTLFWLRSEEHIRKMGCLEWQERLVLEFDYDENEYKSVTVYDLVSTNRGNQWHFGLNFVLEERDSEYGKQLVENAINQQLAEYMFAKKRLEEMQGLTYSISDEDWSAGNAPQGAGIDYFRSQPVYWISNKGESIEQSNSSAGNVFTGYAHDFGYGYGYNYYDYGVYKQSCFIAFDNNAVSSQNAIWKNTQRLMTQQLILIAAPLVIALACMIILISGAGRRRAAQSVHFIAIDKPWLDIGLCFVAAFVTLLVYGYFQAARVAWDAGNELWIITLSAALSVFATLPLLGWFLSFVKHCKAGKFWRYTLIYNLFSRLWKGLKKLAQSIWAGFPLTIKAVLLGVALFAAAVLCISLSRHVPAALILALFLSAAALLLMLRYAHRLHLVTKGAKEASEGRYGVPIEVTGAELGSISASINSISDGINIAVAERLKSERLKTELITNISHDIRTPLTSVITYSDLLKSEGLSSDRAPEYLDVLIQKSARLKTLTDDLFEASKAASGNIEVHMENLDLADFVRQVLGELDERVRASNLDFRLNLPEHAPVRADGRLLWRVMENLLSNVFKYALPGSRVYIDVTRQGDGSPVYKLEIKNISDHPLNIEPSELTERFKRGDDSRSSDGSGLGLSIAQSFVQAQGGSFELSIDGDLFKASVCL
ncbi:MAG: HAMP domain-containing histidine kinase [Oscillospiraceae bacterium]|nr:HAMP domain-containing histidine kinase [Oscillospiraceae bacterium]